MAFHSLQYTFGNKIFPETSFAYAANVQIS